MVKARLFILMARAKEIVLGNARKFILCCYLIAYFWKNFITAKVGLGLPLG